MELGLMLEGQNGLNWQNFAQIATAVDEMGFTSLHRSDHFVNDSPPDLDSLPLWPSLTWLASNTHRIEFGPLVTPTSFRHPVHTARMAAAVDDLSGGRLWLGLGAGWNKREHQNFGFDLLDVDERFDRFEDGLEVITRLLESDEPVNYESREAVENGEAYYYLDEAILLPRPGRAGGPPILIGGNGPQYTLPLVAKYADIWNGVFISPEDYAERNEMLDELLSGEDRLPDAVRRTVMVSLIYGKDDAELKQRLEQRGRGRSTDELLQVGILSGTAEAIAGQLNEYAERGAERAMIQWLDLDDVDGIEKLADGLLGQV